MLLILTLLLLISFVFIMICVSDKRTVYGGNEPNLSLLRDHGVDGKFEKWAKSIGVNDDPFVLKFEKNNQMLYYIATKHTNDKNSKTFELIKKYAPLCDVILIEGFRNAKGMNPMINGGSDGEMQLAIDIAKENNISYGGVEGEEPDFIKKLKDYRLSDICLWYFLRGYTYMYKMGKSKEDVYEDFNNYGKTYLEKIFKADISFDFDSCFKKTFGKIFKFGKYLNYSAPYENGNITQRISNAVELQRNKESIINLYSRMKEFNKVCYLMGKNHAYSDYLILEDTFGAPQIITA